MRLKGVVSGVWFHNFSRVSPFRELRQRRGGLRIWRIILLRPRFVISVVIILNERFASTNAVNIHPRLEIRRGNPRQLHFCVLGLTAPSRSRLNAGRWRGLFLLRKLR
jgi:hypothetical protein